MTISEKGIEKLFLLDYKTTKPQNIKVSLQIANFKEKSYKNGKIIYTAFMRDRYFQYKRFVIEKAEGDPAIEKGLIIEINQLKILKKSNNDPRIFVILHYINTGITQPLLPTLQPTDDKPLKNIKILKEEINIIERIEVNENKSKDDSSVILEPETLDSHNNNKATNEKNNDEQPEEIILLSDDSNEEEKNPPKRKRSFSNEINEEPKKITKKKENTTTIKTPSTKSLSPSSTKERRDRKNSEESMGSEREFENIKERSRSKMSNYEEEKLCSGTQNYFPLQEIVSKCFYNEVILVRVLQKSTIITFQKTDKEGNLKKGQLFDFLIVDKEQTKMYGVCYNNEVDHFYDQITANNVYEIDSFSATPDVRRSKETTSEFKIVLLKDTIIRKMEDDGSILRLKIPFTQLDQLDDIKVHTNINCLVSVCFTGVRENIRTRNGELPLRRLKVCDKSGRKVEIALWRNWADIEPKIGDILLIKEAKVGDFSGRSLSTFNDTEIIHNPSESNVMEEVVELKQYFEENRSELTKFTRSSANKRGGNRRSRFPRYGQPNPRDRGGNSGGSTPFSYTRKNSANYDTLPKNQRNINSVENYPIYHIAQMEDLIYDEASKNGVYAKYINYRIKACVISFENKRGNIHLGCDHCGARVLLDDFEEYNCTNCKVVVPKPIFLFSASLKLRDCTGMQNVIIDLEIAEKFFGMTAYEYKDLLDGKDNYRLSTLMNKIDFEQYFFVISPKVKIDPSTKKVTRISYKVTDFEKCDKNKEAKRVVKSLRNGLNIQ